MLETTFAAVSAERVRQVCGDEPGWYCRNVLDWTDNDTLADAADFLIGKPIKILLILLLAVVVNRIARRGMKRALRTLQSGAVQERLGSLRAATPEALLRTTEHSLRAEQRIEALSSVLRSLVTVVIYLVAGFMILGEVGINLGPLLAGAGIIGVALGFGSQALVRDFLSGVFILIEDQFDVGVAYDTNLDHAKSVIAAVAHEIAEQDSDVLDEPEVGGVEALGANGITIRLVVKTRPSEQYRVSRELRQRLKAAFEREGIEIPFPQQTVWHRTVATR